MAAKKVKNENNYVVFNTAHDIFEPGFFSSEVEILDHLRDEYGELEDDFTDWEIYPIGKAMKISITTKLEEK